jgi:hypothetical protein
MKTVFSLFGGAALIQEQAGDFYLNFDDSVGGGAAAGILSGKGSLKLGTGSVGLKLAENWINSHVPASVEPFVLAGETYLNNLVAAQ